MKDFLNSPRVKLLSLIISISGLIMRVVGVKLPNSLNTITNIVLFVIGAYALVVVFLFIQDLIKTGFYEINYRYYAKRFGMGYRSFDLQCVIQLDGSAVVYRDVVIDAYSDIDELDTYVNIAEEDPEGLSRRIIQGKVESKGSRDLRLKILKNKPGSMYSTINISPPLRKGESLQYRISDFNLSKGLYAINLSQEEIDKRESKQDYYGWHIIRPTKKFVLQIYFPPNIRPIVYGTEVRYARASAYQSDKNNLEEQKRIKPAGIEESADRYKIRLEVDYPLYGLIYILRWEPIPKG